MKKIIFLCLCIYCCYSYSEVINSEHLYGKDCTSLGVPRNSCTMSNQSQKQIGDYKITDYSQGVVGQIELSGNFICHLYHTSYHSYFALGLASERSISAASFDGKKAFYSDVDKVYYLANTVVEIGAIDNRIEFGKAGKESTVSGDYCAVGSYREALDIYLEPMHGLVEGINTFNFKNTPPRFVVSRYWTSSSNVKLLSPLTDTSLIVQKTTCDFLHNESYDLGSVQYSDLPIEKNFNISLLCNNDITKASIKFEPPKNGSVSLLNNILKHQDINVDMSIKDGSSAIQFNKFYDYSVSDKYFEHNFTAIFSDGGREKKSGKFDFSITVVAEYL